MFRSSSRRYSSWKGICQPVWLTNSAGRPALPPALATCPPWTASGTRGRWLCRRWRHGSSPNTWSVLCGSGSWGLLSLLTGRPTCCFTCLCWLLSFYFVFLSYLRCYLVFVNIALLTFLLQTWFCFRLTYLFLFNFYTVLPVQGVHFLGGGLCRRIPALPPAGPTCTIWGGCHR
jgi:hypothetical protein